MTPAAGLPTVTLDADGKPSITPVDAAAPTELVVQPLITGTGAPVTEDQTLTVNYTGWLYDPAANMQRGAQFDSSSGREPFSFEVGGGQVIPGWDQGVLGMKVGGKRTLVVPAELGYGESGVGPIPPNATLVFEVELLDVR